MIGRGGGGGVLIQSTGAVVCQLENIGPGWDAGSITAE